MACSCSSTSLSRFAAIAARSLVAAESDHAPTRVKMCEGMGSGGGNARVAPGRGHAFLRDGRSVIAVDEVVRDPGMVGIFRELLLQDVRGGQVGLIALIGQGLRRGEVEGVENLRLVVSGIARGQGFEGAGTIQLAR